MRPFAPTAPLRHCATAPLRHCACARPAHRACVGARVCRGRGPWSSFQLDTRANNPDLDRSVEYELIFNTTDCLGHLFSEQAQVNRTEGACAPRVNLFF